MATYSKRPVSDEDSIRNLSSECFEGSNQGSENAPVADWLDPAVMSSDPYPSYERLRSESPIAWAPAFKRYLVTSYSGCLTVEQHPEVFTSNVSGGTMVRALGGQPMLRKDDPEHAVERQAVNPTLRPKRMKEVWADIFERNAESYLEQLISVGPDEADLDRDFAAPYASKNLIDVLGLGGVDVGDLRAWSHAFIAGIGNVLDDEEIWRRCDVAQAEVEAVLDERIPYLKRHPDDSMISLMISAGLSEDQIRSNVKLTISGGMNEPQHAITNIVWLLDRHDETKARVLGDGGLWPSVFDEAVRWQSPIGMFPRETVESTEIDGVRLPAGAPVGVVVASANRDEQKFKDPDVFNVAREAVPHLGFGSGAHMCAGRWAAKSAVGDVGVPRLYQRLPGLRVDDRRETGVAGWVFRGITKLPVTW
ncbi:cytochrome P450 [Aquisalimonas lutea]|uniref:cytochrome P450 n=1 Tax=Aquisalimonas lutea TaxID=1327750 RepID=UPI0025B2EEFA|nr:cytochrome P450 [Aquisalimonas lutea]MDN3518109.1 cytochrome P450 [Aquisalimonas lutea]